MIRGATIADVGEVVDIYNQAIDAGFQTAYTTRFNVEERMKWFQQHIDSDFPIFVYLKEGTIAGWISISPYRQDRAALRHTIEISYFIHKNYQRKGIGTQLLAYAIAACRQLNHKTALAILIDNNLGSIKLLEKFGFERWGYLPGVADFNGVECGQYYYGLRLS